MAWRISYRATGTHSAQKFVDDELGHDLAFPSDLSPGLAYEWLWQHQKIQRDEHQLAALRTLDAMHDQIARSREPTPSLHTGSRPGVFGGLFSMFAGGSGAVAAPSPRAPPNLRGAYLFGGPGCGKTFMMDIFYRCAPTTRKRRAHFHSFMLDVHARLHAVRQGGYRGDPVPIVAAEMAKHSWLMCFDEMQVTDVGDAMIMRRLFTHLFELGLVVVATSNRAPRELYHNGLQRELFLPFIDLIEARCTVVALDSPTDYRLLATPLAGAAIWICPTSLPAAATGSSHSSISGTPVSAVPHTHAATAAHHHTTLYTKANAAWDFATAHSDAVSSAFNEAWHRVVGAEPCAATKLTAQGREVHIPVASLRYKAARFTFNDLCARPIGSADYQVLAQHFATVFISEVPILTLSQRNELRRFITLIDTLYEHRVKVVISAPVPPSKLFVPKFQEEADAPLAAAHSLRTKYDEVFAFDRTLSRLMEMQSEEYLRGEWRPSISKSGTLEGAPPPPTPAADTC